ncbi:DNA replication/repair protein RecF [Nesterenkonia sp. CL21]|uniref:DNA replication/repair protein RecF n=1 Tax=Nesterenkonia sp. CL21 TaxID=3064894 RepID=UPI00287B2009|nr:DNA replication/repair protein RecF [Nesterenkonia sp. CL21]MDS2173404.1 DNA replication/repair protein RecF [Nesterenkonia sp. CL21]
MRLSTLNLKDYRSYADVELTLHPGPNVLLGYNGVGKTNIAEAIGYLSTLGSHRVSQDVPLVRHGCTQAVIRAQAHRGSQEAMLEVEINPGRSNRARINRGAPVRATEVLGILRTVLFAPEDLELIKGAPAVRRRFFDDLAVQLRPALGRVRLDYEKVLRQRNALLKSIRHEGFTPTHESTLAVWDHQLADAGSRLMRARLEVLAALRPHVAEAYRQLSGSVRTARLRYESSLVAPEAGSEISPLETADRAQLADLLRDGLEGARKEERDRAQTLVGPHRDDIAFTLDDVPVKGFASHGETWSFALSLRLAAYRTMVDDDPADGARPLLILDDVFAELDARRRRRLAELVGEAEQLIVTAAVDDDVPESLLQHGLRVESVDQVSQVSELNTPADPSGSDAPDASDTPEHPDRELDG